MKKGLFLFCPIFIGSIGIALVRSDLNTPVIKQAQKSNVSTVIGCAPGAEENVYADNDGKFITFCLVGVTIRTGLRLKMIVLKFISIKD